MDPIHVIKKHYEKCFAKYGDSAKGMDWPNEKDSIIRYKVMLEIIDKIPSRLMDFGCGTARIVKYIPDGIDYVGVDINSDALDVARNKYPELTFSDGKKLPQVDYIIANGIFTEKITLSHSEMWVYTQKTLDELWKHCNRKMAVNFISTSVEWCRLDLFHLDIEECVKWIVKHTKNYTIRCDYANKYGLYEYTIYMAKKR